MIERNQNKTYKEFPLAPLIKNCYLKKIEYKCEEKDGVKSEYMSISINKEDRWINARYYNPVKALFEDTKSYQRARQRIRRCLEHIASTYFNTEGMRELLKNPGGTFESYVNNFSSMMESINYKEIPIDIKTVKYNGRIVLPNSPFFIKRAGDQRIEFFYSERELEQLNPDS